MGNAFQHFGLQRQRCVATGTAQRNGDARRSALGRTVGNHSPLGMEQGAGHRPAAMAPVKAQVWVTLRWLEPRLLLLQINVMSDAEPPSGTLSIVSSTNGPVAGVGPLAEFRTIAPPRWAVRTRQRYLARQDAVHRWYSCRRNQASPLGCTVCTVNCEANVPEHTASCGSLPVSLGAIYVPTATVAPATAMAVGGRAPPIAAPAAVLAPRAAVVASAPRVAAPPAAPDAAVASAAVVRLVCV